MLWIAGIAAAALTWGYCLGGRRLTALLVGAIAGAATAPQFGPALSAALTVATSWNTWAGEAACWVAAYVVMASGTVMAIRRLLPGPIDAAPSRRVRFVGAGLGGVLGAVTGWIALGNFADLVVEHLPAESALAATGKIRRPFEMIRACRVLCKLSEREATAVARHPDVQAVLANESFEKLLRAPATFRNFSQAAEGDWIALAALAADPTVKAAMGEPMFLEQVRTIDVVALAADVERRRNGVVAPDEDLSATATLPDVLIRTEFREGVAADWFANDGPTESPSAADAYWRTVDDVLTVFDRPTSAAAWLPRLATPPTFDDSSPSHPLKDECSEPGDGT